MSPCSPASAQVPFLDPSSTCPSLASLFSSVFTGISLPHAPCHVSVSAFASRHIPLCRGVLPFPVPRAWSRRCSSQHSPAEGLPCAPSLPACYQATQHHADLTPNLQNKMSIWGIFLLLLQRGTSLSRWLLAVPEHCSAWGRGETPVTPGTSWDHFLSPSLHGVPMLDIFFQLCMQKGLAGRLLPNWGTSAVFAITLVQIQSNSVQVKAVSHQPKEEHRTHLSCFLFPGMST